jgi:hypothetical protein
MAASITIEARAEAVRATLAECLTPDELGQFSISEEAVEPDPFEASGRGEALTFFTVLVWTGQAVASGVVYDLVKKASVALQNKFGKESVATQGDPDA